MAKLADSTESNHRSHSTSWPVRILIVGVVVLAMVLYTWPHFAMFGCRAKQAVARSELRRIAQLQRQHHDQHHSYANTLVELGYVETDKKHRYELVITTATATMFVAEARGTTDGLVGDLWSVDERDERGEPKNLISACRLH
jgi:hypothetical protein